MKLTIGRTDLLAVIEIAAIVLYAVKKVRERTVVNSVLQFQNLSHHGDGPAIEVNDGRCTIHGASIEAHEYPPPPPPAPITPKRAARKRHAKKSATKKPHDH